ncbi:unnamed protein product [Meloidogyne enterolobii]|uniref:Uncharacterized protein n=1 Tax=Meloidogyne enterolobii TaxID=390850 RepID=A0ACB1ANP1_MELEN
MLLILQNTLENPSQRTICTLGELLGDKLVYVALLASCLIIFSVLCNLMVWIKLKWDMRKSNIGSWN